MRHALPMSLTLLLAIPSLALAQGGKADRDALVKNALSAAPPEVAAGATVMDLDQNVLREGTNGWTCFPDNPNTANNSPICVDDVWAEVLSAYMGKREPKTSSMVGLSYMLQGDEPVSNKDPYATGPTPDNEWIENAPPHIMIWVPDQSLLEDLPTDPHNGGPWVMWKGTPYAHIMMPTPRRTK